MGAILVQHVELIELLLAAGARHDVLSPPGDMLAFVSPSGGLADRLHHSSMLARVCTRACHASVRAAHRVALLVLLGDPGKRRRRA
jgi:hypothetical protein